MCNTSAQGLQGPQLATPNCPLKTETAPAAAARCCVCLLAARPGSSSAGCRTCCAHPRPPRPCLRAPSRWASFFQFFCFEFFFINLKTPLKWAPGARRWGGSWACCSSSSGAARSRGPWGGACGRMHAAARILVQVLLDVFAVCGLCRSRVSTFPIFCQNQSYFTGGYG